MLLVQRKFKQNLNSNSASGFPLLINLNLSNNIQTETMKINKFNIEVGLKFSTKQEKEV